MIRDKCTNSSTHEVLGKHRGSTLLGASTFREELQERVMLPPAAQGQRGIHEAQRDAEGQDVRYLRSGNSSCKGRELGGRDSNG